MSTSAPILEPADGLPAPRRYYAIAAIWMAVGMAVLDSSIANVALPTIAREVGASPGASIWIINAYQLAITASLLPLASLGDKIGYRRVYTVGLVVFTLGSLACALSPGLPQLAAARILQGLGGSAIMSLNPALIRFIVPQRTLGRWLGFNAMVVAAGAVVGPTIASAILAVAPWPWLFAVNVPLGVIAVAVSWAALPRTEGSGARLDFISAALNAGAFGGLILGAETATRDGILAASPILAGGLVAGVLLVARQLPLPAPLLPIDLLRIPVFRLSMLTSICSFAAQMLAFVALPFFLQSRMGRSAVEVGLLMTPWPVVLCVAAPLAGRAADRISASLLCGVGLAIFAAGLALLALLPSDASDLQVIWRMMVCGLGFGLFQSPNNRVIVTSAPRQRAGAAGGMLATARLLGQTIGAVTMAGLFHAGVREPTLAGFATASVIAAAAAGVSLLRMRAETSQPQV